MLLVSLAILLVAAGTIHLVRADVVSAGSSESILQSRMNMRSAVRAYGLELISQRGEMFLGRAPDVPEDIELFEVNGQLAVARLIPLGPGGQRVVAEAGKLDLNQATQEMLTSTGVIDAAMAEAIITARNSLPNGKFRSVHDLLAIEGNGGIDETVMYGQLDDMQILSRVDSNDENREERVTSLLSDELGGEIRGLLDVCTVHSFEPDVRKDGRLRMSPNGGLDSVNIPFEYERAQACVNRLVEIEVDAPPRMADVLSAVLDDFSKDSESFSSADAQAEAFDSVSNTSQVWRNGLIDINSAPQEVLVSIPGITPQIAEALIETRDSIREEFGFDRMWPIREGVVDPDVWATIIDGITTRSFLWRMRIVAGTMATESEDDVIESPLVWEVLFDCSVSPARVVEVRDITMLELVARMINTNELDADRPLTTNTEIDASAANGGIEFGDPLFQDTPLFDDEPLFNDGPLFEDPPLFEAEPLFQNEPLFESSESPRGRPNSEEIEDSKSGPSGRWSPAASQR